jgi:hypothetical protein
MVVTAGAAASGNPPAVLRRELQVWVGWSANPYNWRARQNRTSRRNRENADEW